MASNQWSPTQHTPGKPEHCLTTSEAISIAIHVLSGSGERFSQKVKEEAAGKLDASYGSGFRGLPFSFEKLEQRGVEVLPSQILVDSPQK